MTTNANNHVKLVVNLGTTPTITNTNGQRMAAFSACTFQKDPQSGLTRKKWYTTICWGALADVAEKHLYKGKRVMICGNLVTRKWTSNKGEKREREQLVATHILLLDSGARNETAHAA